MLGTSIGDIRQLELAADQLAGPSSSTIRTTGVLCRHVMALADRTRTEKLACAPTSAWTTWMSGRASPSRRRGGCREIGEFRREIALPRQTPQGATRRIQIKHV